MRHTSVILIASLITLVVDCQLGFAAQRNPSDANFRSRSADRASPGPARAKAAKSAPRTLSDPLPRHLRDPFAPLLADQPKGGKEVVRPPGKAGLAIDEIVVQGTVTGPHGAVAVVSSPDGHVYFLRPGDRLFDGTVERIELNDVVFIQRAHDAFGREFDRRVIKSVQLPEGVKP